MRKLSFVFALSLLTTAAAPTGATIDADCNPGCVAGKDFKLVGDGYNPNKMYDIEISDPDAGLGPTEIAHSVLPDANGHISVGDLFSPAADTWNITVFTENHNATPGKKVIAAQNEVVFSPAP